MAVAKNHSSTEVQAKPNFMTLILKTTPLPVFMPIIMKNSEQLGLSQRQKEEFAQWRTESMGPAMMLANSIIEGDKAIKEAALSEKGSMEIQEMIKHVLEQRSELANKTLLCRENSRRILSEKQWSQVISLYREMLQSHYIH